MHSYRLPVLYTESKVKHRQNIFVETIVKHTSQAFIRVICIGDNLQQTVHQRSRAVRLMGELILQASVVGVPSSTYFEHLLRNAEPIKAKFYMESHWDKRTKVCSNDPRHVTKIAAMPIYDRKPSKIFFETSGPMTFELGIHYQ